jgi:hypothetical protein
MDLCKICGERHQLGDCHDGGKVKLQVREIVPQDHGSPAEGHPDESQGETVATVALVAGVLKKKRAPRGTFDRNKYQREYMRKRRAKKDK